jgi:hypothetical protein
LKAACVIAMLYQSCVGRVILGFASADKQGTALIQH